MTFLLDVARLPANRPYGPGHQHELAAVIHRTKTGRVIDALTAAWGITPVSRVDFSVGFVIANPQLSGRYETIWDKPYDLAWLCVGWGNKWKRNVCNALRMMRASAREGQNSLTLCKAGQGFRDIVEAEVADGQYPWGDLPHGGAVLPHFGGRQLLGAVHADGFDEIQNEIVASLLIGMIYREISLIDTSSQL